MLFLFWLLISALGFESLAYSKWPFVSFTLQTLGDINIYKIHKRFTYTKSMVDLVMVPNVKYNQGLQGLSSIIGGSVSTEWPSVPSALIVFLLHARPWVSLGLPGYPWASPGIPLGLPGVPWGSLGLPGAPWASLLLRGAAEGPPRGRRGAAEWPPRGRRGAAEGPPRGRRGAAEGSAM